MVNCPNCGKRAVITKEGYTCVNSDCPLYGNLVMFGRENLSNLKGHWNLMKQHKGGSRFQLRSHLSKNIITPLLFAFIGVTVGTFLNLLMLIPTSILYAFYMLFPSELNLRRAAEKDFESNFPTITTPASKEYVDTYIAEHMGLIYLKSFLKTTSIFFFAITFFGIHKLLFLVVLIAGYFSLPSGIDPKKPEKTSQAVMKFLLSLIIPFAFWYVLNAPLIGLIALAFFLELPSEISIKGQDPGKALFAIIMLIATLVIFVFPERFGGWGITVTEPLGITIGSLMIISFFSGLSAGHQARPYIGAMIIPFILIAFTSTYPQAVGTAVFGVWWPTVDNFMSTTFAPIGEAWTQATEGMSTAFLMLMNPSEYYRQEMLRQQTAGKLTSGGTIKSIEVTRFDTLTSEIYPEQHLVGTIELENRGEFNAKNIIISLNDLFVKDERGNSKYITSKYKFETCTGGKIQASKEVELVEEEIVLPFYKLEDQCLWEGASYGGDIKLASFSYTDLGKLNWCVCKKEDKPVKCKLKYLKCEEESKISCDTTETCKTKFPEECVTDTDCTKSYLYANEYATLILNYSFGYNVNVSLPVEVMEPDIWTESLRNKEIKLEEKTSQYSGGPVMASIWVQKQPLRSGESAFGRVSITNKGTGSIKQAVLIFRIPKDMLGEIKEISKIRFSDCVKIEEDEEYAYITCTLNNPIKDQNNNIIGFEEKTKLNTNEFAMYAFTFTYDIPEGIDKKSVIFTGTVGYTYEGHKEITLPVAWIPLEQ